MKLNEKNSQFTSDWQLESWRQCPRRQGVIYPDLLAFQSSVHALEEQKPLVNHLESQKLLSLLQNSLKNQDHRSERFFLHIGDCAEVFSEVEKTFVQEKLRFYRQLANCLATTLNKEVVIIARMAGQFAKPRSQVYEIHQDRSVLSYRGDMIHEQELCQGHGRTPDPRRMLRAYEESAKILQWTRELKADDVHGSSFFSSHEALHLDYESALTRKNNGNYWGGSAHFLWLGERTRFPESAHVEYLRGIANPIGIKIGPDFIAEELLTILKRITSKSAIEAELTRPVVLIPRFGITQVTGELKRLIDLVQDHNLPLLWFLDPMHGNTLTAPCGRKTRRIQDICDEVVFASQILHQAGISMHGLHLEASFERVTECVGGMAGVSFADLAKNYKSAVDPRLNFSQSFEVVLTAGEALRSYETSSSGFKGLSFDSPFASLLSRS